MKSSPKTTESPTAATPEPDDVVDVVTAVANPDDGAETVTATESADAEGAIADEADAEGATDEGPAAEGGDATDEQDEHSDAADEQDESEEPGGGDAEAPSPGRWRRVLRRVLQGAAVLLLVAVVAAGGYFGWEYKKQRDLNAATQAALATARDYAVVLTSLDNAKIDENTAMVLDGATGEFKDLYSRSSAQLRQLLIDNKAGARGTVLDAGVKSATPTRVEVLLFVDQAVTNSTNPTPRFDRNRVTMTMELVDGRWLASKVEVF